MVKDDCKWNPQIHLQNSERLNWRVKRYCIFALFQYMTIPFLQFEFISLIVPCLLMWYCTNLYGKPPSCKLWSHSIIRAQTCPSLFMLKNDVTCRWFFENNSRYSKLRKWGIINSKIQELLMQGMDVLFNGFYKLKNNCFLFGSFIYIFGFLY